MKARFVGQCRRATRRLNLAASTTSPADNYTPIGMNVANGPAAVALNLRVSRSFGIGPRLESPDSGNQIWWGDAALTAGVEADAAAWADRVDQVEGLAEVLVRGRSGWRRRRPARHVRRRQHRPQI